MSVVIFIPGMNLCIFQPDEHVPACNRACASFSLYFAFLNILMFSDKAFHKAFRTHKTISKTH